MSLLPARKIQKRRRKLQCGTRTPCFHTRTPFFRATQNAENDRSLTQKLPVLHTVHMCQTQQMWQAPANAQCIHRWGSAAEPGTGPGCPDSSAAALCAVPAPSPGQHVRASATTCTCATRQIRRLPCPPVSQSGGKGSLRGILAAVHLTLGVVHVPAVCRGRTLARLSRFSLRATAAAGNRHKPQSATPPAVCTSSPHVTRTACLPRAPSPFRRSI